MEMWWAGFISSPWRLIALLAFTYVLLLGYNRFAGMHPDSTWPEVVVDSVEELGLGLLTSAIVLFLLGRIDLTTPSHEAVGKVVVEAVVVAIGFSIGTAQLNATADRDSHESERHDVTGLWNNLAIAFCGAVLFAANVAPTEEIVVVAIETGPLRLLGVAAVSIAIGSVILYFTNFRRSTLIRRDSHFDVALGTTATYAVALIASAIILWFFGRFDGASLTVAIRQTVVLAFPATLGASAGRLLLT
jgi:putative integral membrane protein (TIGR02587 family)